MHYSDIRSHPERISSLRRFEYDYDWDGLEFSLSIKGISELERMNDVIINMLCVEEKKFYILRGKKYDYLKEVVNLALIDEGERRQYTLAKSFSRLLRSSNTKHNGKQHLCINGLQGFPH